LSKGSNRIIIDSLSNRLDKMPEIDEAGERRLYSVGHSNHSLEALLALLKQHRIEVLVDVRSSPYSKFSPHFDSGPLKKAISSAGLKYLYLGRELGGRPEADEFYDDEGHVLYSRLAESPLFLEGLLRLEAGVQKYRVALLCSEEDPTNCHRRLLIGRALAARQITITHIRGDGRLESEAQLQDEEDRRRDKDQAVLFVKPRERVWRSTQSVLRRGPRKSSSER
jgi:uncharacterized protein (DUF488 family)